MRHSIFFRFICAASIAFVPLSIAQAADLTEDEKAAGFQSLFNGKDFTGWHFVGKDGNSTEAPNWKVADGVIQLSGGGSPHLSSDKQYRNFEMRLEWRAMKPSYNSGFYIRSGPKLGTNQINLAKSAAGNLMAGKEVQGGKPVPELQKPSGEWNEWRVVVDGDHVTFTCNGTEAWQATGLKPTEGYLGLQTEGAPMEFRNLRLRELP